MLRKAPRFEWQGIPGDGDRMALVCLECDETVDDDGHDCRCEHCGKGGADDNVCSSCVEELEQHRCSDCDDPIVSLAAVRCAPCVDHDTTCSEAACGNCGVNVPTAPVEVSHAA